MLVYLEVTVTDVTEISHKEDLRKDAENCHWLEAKCEKRLSSGWEGQTSLLLRASRLFVVYNVLFE
jgi:hypothetical protein